jgi:hypothetical protein
VGERLDEEKIEILRSWGAGLGSDPREEVRAAGKAITVLIEEIDRLQVDLWRSRVSYDGHSMSAGAETEAEIGHDASADGFEYGPAPSPASVLRARLALKSRPA